MVDELEAAMVNNFRPVNCPSIHRFTKGMYIRETTIPKGTLLTSRIHKTNHPFVVTKGRVSVWTEEGDEQIIQAPFTGITQPGTRRILFAHTKVVWTTFHPLESITGEENSLTDEEKEKLVDSFELEIIDDRENKVVGGRYKSNELVKVLS